MASSNRFSHPYGGSCNSFSARSSTSTTTSSSSRFSVSASAPQAAAALGTNSGGAGGRLDWLFGAVAAGVPSWARTIGTGSRGNKAAGIVDDYEEGDSKKDKSDASGGEEKHQIGRDGWPGGVDDVDGSNARHHYPAGGVGPRYSRVAREEGEEEGKEEGEEEGEAGRVLEVEMEVAEDEEAEDSRTGSSIHEMSLGSGNHEGETVPFTRKGGFLDGHLPP